MSKGLEKVAEEKCASGMGCVGEFRKRRGDLGDASRGLFVEKFSVGRRRTWRETTRFTGWRESKVAVIGKSSPDVGKYLR
jgi:hypothetical protein